MAALFHVCLVNAHLVDPQPLRSARLLSKFCPPGVQQDQVLGGDVKAKYLDVLSQRSIESRTLDHNKADLFFRLLEKLMPVQDVPAHSNESFDGRLEGHSAERGNLRWVRCNAFHNGLLPEGRKV